jgi:hypothetical protein
VSVRRPPHKPEEPEHRDPGQPDGAAAAGKDPDASVQGVVPAARGLAPRLALAFARPRAGRAALIPYLTGGHPDLETSARLIATLISAGADIVELGVPFSDPIADGPVVQQSTHVALAAGVTTDDVLGLAASQRSAAPFVLLTYLNSVLARADGDADEHRRAAGPRGGGGDVVRVLRRRDRRDRRPRRGRR